MNGVATSAGAGAGSPAHDGRIRVLVVGSDVARELAGSPEEADDRVEVRCVELVEA